MHDYTNTTPIPNDWIQRIQPYSPGGKDDSICFGGGLAEVRLCSNENPFGGGRRLHKLCQEVSWLDMGRYPHNSYTELRQEIAKFHRVSSNGVLVGNGSSEVLTLIARVFLGRNRIAIRSTYSFSLFSAVALAVDADVAEVPSKDYQHDVDALISAASIGDVLFIDNPCNPTGNYLTKVQVVNMLMHIPRTVLVVLDEAYADYVTDVDFESSIDLTSHFPNLLVVRTFSKIYGLAALRLGYCIGNSTLIEILDKIRPPFSVNALAISIATQALRDQCFVEMCRSRISAEKKRLLKRQDIFSCVVSANCANFIFLKNPASRSIAKQLKLARIHIREFTEYPGHLRITIGDSAENDKFIKAYEAALHNL